jgi:transaldolase
MKFSVDTADTTEIKSPAGTGLLDGVTTNPSPIARSGRKLLEVVAEICGGVAGPVSAEVAATDYAAIVREANVPRHIVPNVAVAFLADRAKTGQSIV